MAQRLLSAGWLVALASGLLLLAATHPDERRLPNNGPASTQQLADTIFVDMPPANVTVNCLGNVPAPVQLTANDGLGGFFEVDPADSPDPAGMDVCVGGVITRTWTATQGTPVVSVSQTITVLPDDDGPVINGAFTLADTVSCDLADPNMAPPNPLRFDTWIDSKLIAVTTNASDVCSGLDDIFNAPPPYGGGCTTMSNTFEVTDMCGNQTLITFTYTTIDTVAPQFAGLPPNDTLSCEEMIPDPPVVTVTDNCTPDLVPTFTETSGQMMDGSCNQHEYVIQRTWSAQDSCGNFTSHTQLIRVVDELPPNYTAPPDVVISCNSDPDDLDITGQVTDATDNCSPADNINVFYEDSVAPGSCPDESVITRTWRAVDLCGNVSGKIQEITIADLNGPTFNVPDDITVDCSEADELSVTGEPTNLSDDCDPAPVVIPSDTYLPGSCPNEYVIMRTWRATDRCDNFTESTQQITVVDNSAPSFTSTPADLILDCVQGLDAAQLFNDWIANRAGASADDNCTLEGDLQWDLFNSGTIDPVSFPAVSCPGVNGAILERAVDIVVTDECGNMSTLTVNFRVLDQTPPTLSNCPAGLTIPTDPGLCTGTATLPPPVIEDECALSSALETLTESQNITSQASPGQEGETPVDPITFQLAPTQALPINAAAPGMLTINLYDADAEAVDEYFLVYGEDGALLGQTNNSAAQCDDSATNFPLSIAQINAWSADGIIEIELVPNIPDGLPGRFAINANCPVTSIAEAQLTFTVSVFETFAFEYSVDGSSRVAVDPIQAVDVSLDQGSHLIRYYATDCAGNTDSCAFNVVVEDLEAPTLNCPGDIVMSLDADSCTQTLTLPLPSGAGDNCAVYGGYQRTLPASTPEALLEFYLDPNLNDYLALEKVLVFDDVAANAFDDVLLTLDFQGDFNTNEAFIEVFGDDGSLLDQTTVGAADCMTAGQLLINIPAATFNGWAADGSITITLTPNDITVPPGVLGDGINPCDPAAVNADGDDDGISFVTATISYSNLSPRYFASGATEIAPTQVTAPAIQPIVTLNRGTTEVFYTTADLAGNVDTCSFNVTIEDNTPPTVFCQPANLFINPSGLQVETVDASQVDNGSFDNCGIDSMWLLPNIFTCDQIGQTVNVTLSVRDVAGNVATCNTVVGIAPERPMPTANSGLCGGDTLFLFANPPPPTGGNFYTFEWFDPSNTLVSTQQNPVLPNIDAADEGPYRVVVRGFSGCTSEGVVNVSIESLPLTPVVTGPGSVCLSEDIVLETNLVPSGNDVKFYWFQGLPPNGVPIDTTVNPMLTISGPHTAGLQRYYLQVEANGCLSAASAAVSVTAFERPPADVTYADTTMCAGETINLGATTVSNVTYHWEGPNGYGANQQFPSVGPLMGVNEGFYYLTTSRGNCVSPPDSTLITVKPRPAQPPISSNSPVCQGQPLMLTTTINGASSYRWESPAGMVFTTTQPFYNIPLATPAHAGSWRLTITQNGCVSPQSVAAVVVVNPKPVVSANSDPNPACVGDEVVLNGFSSVAGSGFSWSGPNGFTSTVQMPILSSVTNAQTGLYQVIGTTANGCRDSAQLTLDILPTVAITGISDNSPACVNDGFDAVLSATTFPPNTGDYIFTWFRNGMPISSSPTLTLPNVTPAETGPYSLEVTTAGGCSSGLVTHVLDLTFNPAQPMMPATGTGQSSFCAGETVTFSTNAYPGNTVQYFWETPNGTLVTNENTLTVTDANSGDSGAYRVYVVRDGCASTVSPTRNITVNPIPSINISSNSPVCEGSVISLSATFYSNGVYNWSGPGAFTAGVSNPVINNANPDIHTGTYRVFVSRDGCVSDTVTTDIMVRDRPSAPTIYSAGNICLDDPDAVLILGVDTASAADGATYSWFANGGATPVGDPTEELVLEYFDFEPFAGGGTFNFSARATVDGCQSTQSNPVPVTFNVIPDNSAVAGMDTTVCSGAYMLRGQSPSMGSGRWSLVEAGNPMGFTIANPDQANTLVSGLNVDGAPYTLQWTLSNGACVNYSRDTVTLDVTTAETAFAGDDILACQDEVINLAATPVLGSEAAGTWSQGSGQVILGVEIDEPGNPSTLVTGLEPDNIYEFIWTVNSVCGMSSDVVLVRISDPAPDAGADFIECNELATGTLMALPTSQGSQGRWTALTPGVVVAMPAQATTEVSNLQPGENLFEWTVDQGFCGIDARDTVVLLYKEPPVVNADEFAVEFNGTEDVLPLDNDQVPPGTVVVLPGNPTLGEAMVINGTEVRYTAPDNFVGTDQLTYLAASEGCPEVSGNITLRIGGSAACKAPSIITPNNDGINDAFVVPCLLDLDQYPRSEVVIFNRWGDEVYRSNIPYDSRWNGTYDGEDLPVDTYFYVVDLGDGSEPLSGYVMIQR